MHLSGFQFHFGSVERINNSGYYYKYGGFQFHFGSVERTYVGEDANDVFMISIPLWFG